MERVSKKLKNVLTVRGNEEKLNEFIRRLKEKFNVENVSLPEYNVRRISANYIDKEWNIQSSIDNIVVYGKKNKTLIVAFSNEESELEIINILQDLKLNARYRYLIEDTFTGVIIKERFVLGKEAFDYEEESQIFELNDYSVARCF